MRPALVTNSARSLCAPSPSTFARTSLSSIPRRRSTRRTTVLSLLYAWTTGAGSPGPATNLPIASLAEGGPVAVVPGAVVAGSVAPALGVVEVVEVPVEVGEDEDSVVGVAGAALPPPLWATLGRGKQGTRISRRG